MEGRDIPPSIITQVYDVALANVPADRNVTLTVSRSPTAPVIGGYDSNTTLPENDGLVAETDPLVGFNVTVNAAAPTKANNVASTFADAKS